MPCGLVTGMCSPGHLNVLTWSPECGHPPALVTNDMTCILLELIGISGASQWLRRVWIAAGVYTDRVFHSNAM